MWDGTGQLGHDVASRPPSGREADPGRQQAQRGSGTLSSQQQGPGGEPGCLHCLFPLQLRMDGTSGVFVGGNVGSNENSLHKLFFKKSETAFFAFLAKTLINSDKTTFPSSRRETPARLGFQVCATTPGL